MSASNPAAAQDAMVPPVRPGLSRPMVAAIVFAAFTTGQILIWLACQLSARGAFRLSLWVSRRFEPLTRRRRQRNLNLFFRSSAKTAADLAAIDKAHLHSLARMRAEVARCFAKTPYDFKTNVHFEGEENLRAVLARGRGALVVSGHTATWWFIVGGLVARGYPVTAIFTPIKFKNVERKLLQLTDRFGARVAFVGRDALRAMRRAAECNEIIYLTFDVTVQSKRAAPIPFGGGALEIDSGPAILAVRNAMPVLQAAASHGPDGRNLVTFYPPEPDELAPETSSPDALCRRWMHRLEGEIQARPAEWWPWGYVDLLEPSPAAKVENAARQS